MFTLLKHWHQKDFHKPNFSDIYTWVYCRQNFNFTVMTARIYCKCTSPLKSFRFSWLSTHFVLKKICCSFKSNGSFSKFQSRVDCDVVIRSALCFLSKQNFLVMSTEFNVMQVLILKNEGISIYLVILGYFNIIYNNLQYWYTQYFQNFMIYFSYI